MTKKETNLIHALIIILTILVPIDQFIYPLVKEAKELTTTKEKMEMDILKYVDNNKDIKLNLELLYKKYEVNATPEDRIVIVNGINESASLISSLELNDFRIKKVSYENKQAKITFQ